MAKCSFANCFFFMISLNGKELSLKAKHFSIFLILFVYSSLWLYESVYAERDTIENSI